MDSAKKRCFSSIIHSWDSLISPKMKMLSHAMVIMKVPAKARSLPSSAKCHSKAFNSSKEAIAASLNTVGTQTTTKKTIFP